MGAVFEHLARDPIRSPNSLVIASDAPLSAGEHCATRRVPQDLREAGRRRAPTGSATG